MWWGQGLSDPVYHLSSHWFLLWHCYPALDLIFNKVKPNLPIFGAFTTEVKNSNRLSLVLNSFGSPIVFSVQSILPTYPSDLFPVTLPLAYSAPIPLACSEFLEHPGMFLFQGLCTAVPSDVSLAPSLVPLSLNTFLDHLFWKLNTTPGLPHSFLASFISMESITIQYILHVTYLFGLLSDSLLGNAGSLWSLHSELMWYFLYNLRIQWSA